MKKALGKKKTVVPVSEDKLFSDICLLIEQAKQRVATYANAGLTLLYWNVGDRVREEVLKNKRADYGAEILPTLSAKLMPIYGEG